MKQNLWSHRSILALSSLSLPPFNYVFKQLIPLYVFFLLIRCYNTENTSREIKLLYSEYLLNFFLSMEK